MPPPVDISNLHPDIKRIILRMEENSIEEIRKISPSWNRIAKEYLKDNRNKLELERVYLRSGHIDSDYNTYGAQDFQMKWSNIDAKRQLHTYAIVPNRSKARIGVGKWLNTHQNFTGATEVTCGPQKIDLSNRERLKFSVKIAIGFLVFLVINIISFNGCDLLPRPTSAIIFLLIVFTSYAVFVATVWHIQRTDSAMDSRRLARLNRFFSSFSKINLLVFDTFCDRDILDKATSSLGETPIDKIEVRVYDCDKDIQNRIVKLTRKHSIKNISIIVTKCAQGGLSDFFCKLAKLRRKTTFYKEVLSYFHRPVEFWEKMTADLKKKEVILQLSTIKDDDFKQMQCGSYVRARLACMLNGAECHDNLSRARGYYRMK